MATKKTTEELIRERAIENYRKQLTEEKLLADMNRYTYEKMYFFIEGTKITPEYARLVDEQQKRNQEYQTQLQKQGETIITTALAENPEKNPAASTLDPEPGSEIPEQPQDLRTS